MSFSITIHSVSKYFDALPTLYILYFISDKLSTDYHFPVNFIQETFMFKLM